MVGYGVGGDLFQPYRIFYISFLLDATKIPPKYFQREVGIIHHLVAVEQYLEDFVRVQRVVVQQVALG